MPQRSVNDLLKVFASDLVGLQQIAKALDSKFCAPEEITDSSHLQQVDFLQQYLGDLAEASQVLSQLIPQGISVDTDRLVEPIKLDDLRRHLLGTDCATSTGTRQGGEVSLF